MVLHGQGRNLSRILNSSHENKWVAIAPDYSCVLAAADTLSELSQLVTNPNAIFHQVSRHDASFAFATKHAPDFPLTKNKRRSHSKLQILPSDNLEDKLAGVDSAAIEYMRAAYEREHEEFLRLDHDR